jgi:Arc/MetJ family transcription regulator
MQSPRDDTPPTDEALTALVGVYSALSQAAAAMHEMFTAYLGAGFSEDQALRLLIGLARPERNATPDEA